MGFQSLFKPQKLDREGVDLTNISVFGFCKRYIGKHRAKLSLILGFELLDAISINTISYAIKLIVDALTGAPAGDISAALPGFYLLVLLNLLYVVANRGSGLVEMLTTPQIRRSIHHDVYWHLQHHNHAFFLNQFSGALANRVSSAAGSFHILLRMTLMNLIPVIGAIITCLTLLGLAHWSLVTFALIWSFIFVGGSYFIALKINKLATTLATVRSATRGHIVDSITNILNVRLFAKHTNEQDFLVQHMDKELSWDFRVFKWAQVGRIFQETSNMVLMISLVFIAIWLVKAGQISAGELVMTFSLVFGVVAATNGLGNLINSWFEEVATLQEVLEVITKPHEIKDRKNAKQIKNIKGDITLNNVSFSYEKETVFQNLNLEIPAGQKVGIVGYSGSGKTTLMNLLLRLYDPESGSISIDAHNIQDVKQESLREQLALIPQDPSLFHRTLHENIAYSKPDASIEDVQNAAKKARAHEFIMNIDEQYDAKVGERGIKLSGGQRQRIAIARAILKDAPILLLDEATSALDSQTEKYIQESLVEIMQNRTVIAIAHRLSTLAHLDRIIVLDKGKIIEDGTHKELLEKNGHYANLWNMQSGGFLPENAD
jgi:ATP-binding cassette subfamily B protein